MFKQLEYTPVKRKGRFNDHHQVTPTNHSVLLSQKKKKHNDERWKKKKKLVE
jgi:hypothetical protein